MKTTRFELTTSHLMLLEQGNYVYENGSVGLDHKRPFGNSDIPQDILRILGYATDAISEKTESRCWAIYEQEIPIAMAVVFQSQSFAPGWYEKPEYGGMWAWSVDQQ